MQYLVELSREHPDLAQRELEQVLQADCDEFAVLHRDKDAGGRNVVIVEADGSVFGRLAMAFRVMKIDHVAGDWEEISWDTSFSGGFRVRSCSDELPKEDVERQLGARIKDVTDNPVDLEEGSILIGVYTVNDRVYIGREVVSIDRGSFERRRSHHRPFSAPVSLHPELARAMVNLSGVPADGTILDPFCGTGGILLEAGLIGCTVYGMDLQEEMVEGTAENLEAFDVSGTIVQGDASTALDRFGAVDAVVADLPYGKASISEGAPEAIAGQIARDDRVGCSVFVSDQSSLCGWEPQFSIYVHKSLSRYIYLRS